MTRRGWLAPFTAVVVGVFCLVEIARKIEEAMGGRVGVNQHTGRVANVLPTLEKGKSADIAAEAVDMSPEHYRRAKAVVDSGVFCLVGDNIFL